MLTEWINFLLFIFKDFLFPLTNVIIHIMFDKMFKRRWGKNLHLKCEVGHISIFKTYCKGFLEDLRLLDHPNGSTVDVPMQRLCWK